MRVVLTGGGTGGHVYPALSVMEECLREEPDSQFLYIGTPGGMEKGIVAKEFPNLPFEGIEISGFRRKLSLDNLKTVLRFMKGVTRSRKLLKRFRPDVVIGTGGYVCGPVVYAAAKLGIPTMIHEQNVIPGLTNKFLSRYVGAVGVSFQGSEKFFPKTKQVAFTGNPRATTFAQADAEAGYASLNLKPGTKIVLMVGGSRGARAINEAMIGMVPLLRRLPDVQFVYATGGIYYDETVKRIKELSYGYLPKQLKVMPYIHNMPELLAASSLLVNRAGASTLSEATAVGIPSILIPSPNVTNNHQEANARWLEKEGGAAVLLERDLTANSLFDMIEGIMSSPTKLKGMAHHAKRMGNGDAAQMFYREMKRLLNKS